MADCILEQRRKPAVALVIVATLSGVYGHSQTRAKKPAATDAAASAASTKVTAVRFWSLGDVTRVAIEVSSEFEFKSERLPNPDRLFFDIRGAKPDLSDKKMQTIAVGDPLLKQIRVAETLPGVTRIVLDLEEPVGVTTSQLSNPNRLVVELRTKASKPGDTAAPPTASVNRSAALAPPDVPSTVPAAEARPHRTFVPPPHRASAPHEPMPRTLIIAMAPPITASARTPTPLASVRRELLPPPPVPEAAAAGNKDAGPIESAPRTVAGKVTRPGPAVPETAEPLPAKHSSDGDRSLTRVLGLKLARVVLDPGHGGHDMGTHGPSGLSEKDVVLDVAQRLGSLIEERMGSEVIYTRTEDTFIPLEERTAIANQHKADLFLSIHANSSPYRSAAGVETYILNFTTSKTALEVAARENASSERSVFDLKETLNKIALKDKIDESREFASRLQTSLWSISGKQNAAAQNRGVKKAPFVVLIGAQMPSVLAEIGFLTNAGDEAALRKNEQRQKIAEALYKGIASYADSLSHFQVAKRE
jgi:N-acetylmuramoyl-L-alanine amidase